MKIFNSISLFVISSLLLSACGGSSNGDNTTNNNDPNALVKVEGGKYNGGIIHLNSIEDFSTLFPPAINDVYSTHIASLGYEGLFKLNQKTLEAEACIAESFELDNAKTKYSFKIRDGIKFHDDACFSDGNGRELVAADIKYCLDYICSNHESNKWFSHFRYRIVGANDYYLGKSEDVSGIKVNGDKEIEINLTNPYSSMDYLLAILSTAIYPKEAIDEYGYEGMKNHLVGTGAFMSKKIENGSEVVFERNPNYWAKDEFENQLPFLSEVNVSFIKDKAAALEAFNTENLDLISRIQVKDIPNVMGTLDEALDGKNRAFDVQTVNSLNTQYYGFLFEDQVFKDKNVRLAFNYAINRDSLIDYILEGEGVAAHGGFVAPMNGYPSDKIKGFYYNPSKAKSLMAAAGYANGKGFPEVTLNINSSGDANKKTADFISQMLLENLGVNVTIERQEMSTLSPQLEEGKVNFWGVGWIPDFPDPSNFLSQFHGKNYAPVGEQSINIFRYNNPAFDKLYETAIKELDTKKRMELYAKADQMIIDDAALMPLMFNIDIRMINPLIKDFPINEMEYRDLSNVYFIKQDKSNVRIYDNLVGEEETNY